MARNVFLGTFCAPKSILMALYTIPFNLKKLTNVTIIESYYVLFCSYTDLQSKQIELLVIEI